MSQSVLVGSAAVMKPEPTNLQDGEAGLAGSKPRMSPWKLAAITCFILSISGAVRFGRDFQFYGIARQSTTCPFPLSEFPETLGRWTAVPNSESHLDPEIARLAGSKDHVMRDYMDSTTREVASVLILYGLADSVFGHTPDVCCRAAGYQAVTPTVDREFSVPESTVPVRFRGFYMSKQGVGATEYSEAVWSFWHAGSWWPEVASRWKLFRYAPAMFKVQVQRGATGISLDNFTCEPLLNEIVRELDARIARAKAAEVNDSKKVVTSR